MLNRSCTPRLLLVFAFATLLVVAKLAAQETDIGEAYECSMSCHDDAQDIYDENIADGVPDVIARNQAFADYMTCVTFCA